MNIVQFEDGKYAVMRKRKVLFFLAKNEFADGDGHWFELNSAAQYTINQYVKVDTLEQAQIRRTRISKNFQVIE
jgi:hypothetical protein